MSDRLQATNDEVVRILKREEEDIFHEENTKKEKNVEIDVTKDADDEYLPPSARVAHDPH